MRIFALLLACASAVWSSVRVEAQGSRYTLVTLIHTNDLHGRVLPPDENGGLARAATVARQIRAEHPNVIWLDAGDIIHGTPEDYLSGGIATVSAMNAAGVAAATAGNHEFDFGADVFRRALAHAQFPLLGANMRAREGGQWASLPPYAILDAGGVRIGVLGLATLQTVDLQWPGRIRDLTFEDPFETARKLVPALREQCDVVVALSHLGSVEDERLAREVPGFDFIIGGHSHTVIADWRWVGDTLIAQTGAYARALGRIDFVVRRDEAGKAEIVSVNGRNTRWSDLNHQAMGIRFPDAPLIPLDRSISPDPDVVEAYTPFRLEAERFLSRPIGEALADIPAGGDEPPAANLVADAVRDMTGADVAVVDTKSVSGGLRAGPLTAGDAFNLIGGYTRQHLVTVRMSGAQLRKALQGEFGRKGRVELAISGARLELQPTPAGPVIQRMEAAGRPLEDSALYTVAGQAYVITNLMNAGGPAEVLAEPSETTREAAIEWIRKLGHVPAPDTGRIRFVQ
jgi:2',3'-cyclic-nucleotide 2'-phosphodiesterase (5'-nucleotidase family)